MKKIYLMLDNYGCGFLVCVLLKAIRNVRNLTPDNIEKPKDIKKQL